jgi:NhaP-type Na+/H+ or K+/H+ antiporter
VAWVTYISADLLWVSSVLAVVACGLTLGWRQHEAFSARDRTEVSAVWNFVVTVFETLVFVLIGLSLRGVLSRLGGTTAAVEQAALIACAVVLAVVGSRFLWVIPGMYLSRAISPSLRKNDPFDASLGLIASWAGMRGVVSLAAALALPTGFPGRDLLLFATFAVIAATVLVQGATLGPLIRWVLKPQASQPLTSEYDELAARRRVAEASLHYLTEAAARSNASPHHSQLVEFYQRRLELTQQVGAMGQHASELRASHFGTALAALGAGRAELIHMHRSGALHDTIVRELEAELDLEELRLRRLSGSG